MPHPHVHSPTYAQPVLRPPSPASSLGTTYAPDATSLSDSEDQLTQSAFERKWQSRLRLGREFAREYNGDLDTGEGGEDNDDGEEMDVDVLMRISGRVDERDREREGWGREPLIAPGVELNEAESKMIHASILRSLRYQVHLLEESSHFEATLLRGSQIALERPPQSTDIDTLMRGMMGMGSNSLGHNHNSDPSSKTMPNGVANPNPNASGNTTATDHASIGTITNGPWNRGTNGTSTGISAGLEGVNVSGSGSGTSGRGRRSSNSKGNRNTSLSKTRR